MFIDFLVIETSGVAQIVHEPKLPAIQAAIKALDGDTKTVVCLVKIAHTRMDIGGGAHQQCVVNAGNDKTFYVAIDPTRGTDPIKVKVNGQENNYPADMLVTKDVALKAAKLFSETGKLEPTVHWRSTAEAPPAPHPVA
jgi:hypothetical protein